MKKLIKRLKQLNNSNEGLSLVELVVTVLIMGMVSLIIILFVSSSKNSYIVVQKEVTMQTEADIATTYISSFAEQAIEYTFTGDYTNANGEVCSALVMRSPEISGASYADFFHVIVFEKDDNVLRFCKLREDSSNIVWVDAGAAHQMMNFNVDATLAANGIYGNKRKLLAKYIDSFNIDDSEKFKTNDIIRLQIGLKYGDSVYSADKNIYSRNISSAS